MGNVVEIKDITIDEILLIRDQWEKNRRFHEFTSEHFGELYGGIVFESRMEGFARLAQEDLKITIARQGDEVVGYCLSTAVNGEGELCTLHVEEQLRGTGIGKRLCDEHIRWMKEKVCTFISVTVSQENQRTIGFYENLGFLPNTIQMVLK